MKLYEYNLEGQTDRVCCYLIEAFINILPEAYLGEKIA